MSYTFQDAAQDLEPVAEEKMEESVAEVQEEEKQVEPVVEEIEKLMNGDASGRVNR